MLTVGLKLLVLHLFKPCWSFLALTPRKYRFLFLNLKQSLKSWGPIVTKLNITLRYLLKTLMLFNLTQADAFALLQHFLGFSKPKHDPSVLVCEDLSTWRNVSLFPSVHLSLTRLSDVGACNFHHRHTFVSVCTVNNCSPPTRTFP